MTKFMETGKARAGAVGQRARKALPSRPSKRSLPSMPSKRSMPSVPFRRRSQPAAGARSGLLVAVGLLFGAVAGLLLDPYNGKRRRHIVRDKGLSVARRGLRRTSRAGRYALSTAAGKRQALAHRHDVKPQPNDPTLANKVRSELFRDPRVPKGDINVMVENGVVLLHGHLDDERLATSLVEQARSVEGVVDVDSHLHVMP